MTRDELLHTLWCAKMDLQVAVAFAQQGVAANPDFHPREWGATLAALDKAYASLRETPK